MGNQYLSAVLVTYPGGNMSKLQAPYMCYDIMRAGKVVAKWDGLP
jgi:hypothetical protein